MLHTLRHEPLPRKPHPKITRPGKRKRVTLIAAIRCQNNIVICADQQETVGGYRRFVNKVRPRKLGEYWLAVAGSGDGYLVDGFISALTNYVSSWPIGVNKVSAESGIRDLLHDYVNNEVRISPANSDDKRLSYVVCVTPASATDTFLWQIHDTVILPVDDCVLIGYDETVYMHEMKRLYRAGMSASQAVFLGVYILSLAKQTSNYVDGGPDVIAIENNYMQRFQPQDIRKFEERMSDFTNAIAALVLRTPDLSIDDVRFQKILDEFQKRIWALRARYLKMRPPLSIVDDEGEYYDPTF